MHKSQKQFYASIYRQNAGEQARATDFVPACAVKMHVTTAIYAKICRKNAVPQSRDAHFDTLFDPAQSKRTWTSHKQFTGKMPRSKVAGQTLREPATWRTRAILCKNLQGKCRRPDGTPLSNPGLLPTTPQCGHIWGTKGSLPPGGFSGISKISLPLPNSGRAKFTPSPVSAGVNLAILHDKAWFIQEYPAVKNKKPKFLGNRPTKASNDDLY
jgi:hypothetical protein